MSEMIRFNTTLLLNQQQYQAKQISFNEEFAETEKELEQEYLNKLKLETPEFARENLKLSHLRSTLNNQVFKNQKKQVKLDFLKRQKDTLENPTSPSHAIPQTPLKEKSIEILEYKLEQLQEQINDIENKELLELERTDQLNNMLIRTRAQHLKIKGDVEDITVIYNRITRHLGDVKYASQKSGTNLLAAQYEVWKMNKIYTKEKNVRSQKIDQKKEIIDTINTKIKDSMKQITQNKLKKKEFDYKTKNMLNKVEKKLEKYTENQILHKKQMESLSQLNLSLKTIAKITGKEIGKTGFNIEEANKIIEEYQLIAYKYDHLQVYYINLTEQQEIFKKDYETLKSELVEFRSINENYESQLENMKQKSSAIFQNTKAETYNQLLSFIEETPGLTHRMISNRNENFSIYTLLYIIQITQRLLTQADYIETETGSETMREKLEELKHKFEDLIKDSIRGSSDMSPAGNENSFSNIENILQFSLYQTPATKNFYLDMFPGEEEQATIFSEKANENMIIRYFTNARELKTFLLNLGDSRTIHEILSKFPMLYSTSHKNIQLKLSAASETLFGLVKSMAEHINEIQTRLENSVNRRPDRTMIRRKTIEMEELFNSTESTDSIKTTDPLMRSIIEFKLKQMRSSKKKNTFQLKDDFEQFLQRFQVLEPSSPRIENPRIKFHEEVNELFNEIPEEDEEGIGFEPNSNSKRLYMSNTINPSPAELSVSPPLPVLSPHHGNHSSEITIKQKRELNNQAILNEVRKIESGLIKVKRLEKQPTILDSPQYKQERKKKDSLLKFPDIRKSSGLDMNRVLSSSRSAQSLIPDSEENSTNNKN